VGLATVQHKTIIKKSPRPVKNRASSSDETRYVYRNLTRKGVVWSIKTPSYRGHPPELAYEVIVKNAFFKVSKKTQSKIRRVKKRFVHAFVCGKIRSRKPSGLEWKKATYNPYKNDSFVTVEDQRVLKSAEYAMFDSKGMWVAGKLEWEQ